VQDTKTKAFEPPAHASVHEKELATLWFDDSGILCARGKNVTRTLAMQKEMYALIKKISDNKPVCLLADTTTGSPQDKPTREYIAGEMHKVFKAMAVVSYSVWGRLLTNTFLALKKPPIPIKLFSDEEEAREWLRQYL